MRKAVASIIVGTAFLIAAVAGFVLVPEHAPGMKHVGRDQFGACEAIGETGTLATPSLRGCLGRHTTRSASRRRQS
jgi:hypothetical protein